MELSSAESDNTFQTVKRKKIISQIAALRATNPAVPLVSTLDLLPEIKEPDVPLNEDVEECSNPDCNERVEKLRLENSNLNQSVDTLTTALRDITRRYCLLKKRSASKAISQQPPSIQEPESPPDHGVTLSECTCIVLTGCFLKCHCHTAEKAFFYLVFGSCFQSKYLKSLK